MYKKNPQKLYIFYIFRITSNFSKQENFLSKKLFKRKLSKTDILTLGPHLKDVPPIRCALLGRRVSRLRRVRRVRRVRGCHFS
jgi:hypothetical protein